jgi:heat shock protein HslJ/membrane-bound inhibitor of C-type lysozyme
VLFLVIPSKHLYEKGKFVMCKFWLLAVFALCFSGCATNFSSSSPKQEGSALELDGNWLIENINGAGVIDKSHLTAMISGNTISGRAGCNNFTGQISRTIDKISIRKLALTRKMCSPALMAQEQRLIGALESANKLEISKDKPWVWFLSKNQATTLKLVKINDGNITKPATGTNTLRAVDLNTKNKQDDKSSEHHVFHCATLGRIEMRFLGPETILLTLPEESVIMQRDKSASGAHYKIENKSESNSETSSFWNKGHEATLLLKNTTYSCTH